MIEFLLSHGPLLAYVGIAVFLMLTGAGLPIPEEVFIIAAGVASSHEALDPWLALSACLLGALVGDCVMYWLGYHFGRNVLREHPRWVRLVSPEREAQIEQMIEKHGLKVLFLARFLVGLRSPVYLSAGILRVPFRRFLLIDLFCASTVIGAFFVLSYKYGTVVVRWIRLGEGSLTLIAGLALAVVAAVYFWRRRRRMQIEIPSETGEEPAAPPDPASPFSAVPEQPEHLEQHVGSVQEVA